MRFKLFLILFIGLFFDFSGAINAEEICYYSNPIEFKKCKKDKEDKDTNLVPKFPLVIEDFMNRIYFFMWLGEEPFVFKSINYLNNKVLNDLNFTNLSIKSSSEEKLELIFKEKTVSLWAGIFTKKYNSLKTKEINSKDILSWSFKFQDEQIPGCMVNCKWRYSQFTIDYLDDFGNRKEIKGNYRTNYRDGSSIVKNLLENVSKLNSFESRNEIDILNSKLKRNEKSSIIIKSIIYSGEDKDEKCLIAKENKFPQLASRYKKLYKTINPLRSKLDLPPNTDLKPICS